MTPARALEIWSTLGARRGSKRQYEGDKIRLISALSTSIKVAHCNSNPYSAEGDFRSCEKGSDISAFSHVTHKIS